MQQLEKNAGGEIGLPIKGEHMRTKIFLAISVVSSVAVLVACGGSSSPATVTTTISGAAVKGPVNGATVTVKNATTGAVVGSTKTGTGGVYSLPITYVGDVVVEVSGGKYTDEATGLETDLATPLKVVLNAKGGAVTGVVTPLTTMAYTYAVGTGSTTTSSAFNTWATKVADQFKLSGVNLATTTPTVSGSSMDSYGKVLAGVSQYLKANSVTLPTLTNSIFTEAQWSTFSGSFTTAYNTANPGSTVTYSFDGKVFTLTGTGAGGGSGSCGVHVQGTVTANGFSVPLNLDYCVTGIAGGSCDAGNSSLSQGLSGQGGVAGAADLKYTYSATCAAGALTFALK
jgi:hypothetical protein